MKRIGVLLKRIMVSILAAVVLVTGVPFPGSFIEANAAGMTEEQRKMIPLTVEQIANGYRMTNGYFEVETGAYGQLTSIKIVDDLFPTNYIMNMYNAPNQNTAAHQWMGELMFQTRFAGNENWDESMTSKSDSVRKVELIDNKVVVTYENAAEEKGINDFKLVESYYLADDQLKWDITVENTNASALEIGDFGVPLAFNEYWPGGEEIYETRVVDHTFIGKDSSYIYATRPSGLGQFLLMTPDVETGAGFEYQDHWRVEERSGEEAAWCQDQAGWANGLNVFYIHSQVIQKTNRGYLENTSLTLQPGESKTYGFSFSIADDEDDMKSTLYEEGIIDAVAVPGMTFSKNMPAKMYLHTIYDAEDISLRVKCPHELDLHEGNPNTVCNMLECKKTAGSQAVYLETKVLDGEQYHIYELSFEDLGQNDIYISYDNGSKETELQFYIMDDVEEALNTHSDFMVEKTQWDAEGEIYDKVFDDWMMDDQKKRGEFYGYWGWGDDWGLTHGEYIAEKNVFIPVAKEIEAVDEYLDVAIWNGLMQEHQEDYLIHDFLMAEPNTTPTYRGYAYAHIYNTYYSMYKIASKYPDMTDYIETPDTYLMRAYNILKAMYSDGVAYNWETGVMGELTTPDIIQSLKKEGYYDEASNVEDIMARKYQNFKNTKYPYGSEYSYDNTGEEAVYTLAKVNLENDTANANTMMNKIDAKTRACRGLQPIWYHYANPTTICGENWWNFQYTAALAGYCMDDWLRLQDNNLSATERAEAARVNYAAKLANLTCINSGQIDANPGNIGTVSWTYQSEMGNLGGQGTGGGNLHNGWRQMAGEADLGLFGALQILSADVANDPVFGVFGYGCEVEESGNMYCITPLDGLQTRLNLIDDQLYVELDRDKYTYAEVAKDCSDVELTIKNLEKTEHDTEVNVTGLADGAYSMVVEGMEVGTFKAEKGKTSTISVPLPQADTVNVSFKSGASIENTAPVVNAGADKEVFLPAYDGIDNVTMAIDVKLTASQENNTRLFEFGDMDDNYLYVSFKNGNKMYLSATDVETGKLNTVDTEVQVAPDYWKNIALTIEEGDISLYVDGVLTTEIADSGFAFSEFGDVQRNFLGRSADDSVGFLQGYIDNFEMYSYAMTAEEIAAKYGNGLVGELVSVEPVTLITPVGEPAEFPETVRGLFSNGLYRDVNVVWDDVDAAKYETAGNFDVEGRIVTGTYEPDEDDEIVELPDGIPAGCVNLAPMATAEGSQDKVDDGGGLAELNDQDDALLGASASTENGFWHTWESFGADEWVQYNWDEAVTLTGMDLYYFATGDQFKTGALELSYLADDGEWVVISDAEGMGTDLDTWNTTVFTTPITTTSLKMVLTPLTNSVGILEWKVYGSTASNAIALASVEAEGEAPETINKTLEEQLSTVAVVNEEQAEEIKAVAHVMVVEGTLQNLAPYATATAIVNTPEDLGGVAGLNDGYDPSSSGDTSHGVWHNWLGGDQGGEAWVQYTWDEKVIITSQDAYYFKDGGGNFASANANLFYLNDNNEWIEMSGVKGLGVDLDQYNTTTFDAVATNAIRMTMNPKTLGVGVIEWKVYGYSDRDVLDTLKLKEAIALAESLDTSKILEGWDAVQIALENAKTVLNNSESVQEELDAAAESLGEAIVTCKPVDGNLAYLAGVETSYVSGWEVLNAVKDGELPASSTEKTVNAYGSWGNASAYETITYKWPASVTLENAGIYLWTDGGGILFPSSYEYSYWNGDSWVVIPNANGYGLDADKLNVTEFDPIETTQLQVKLNKQVEDGNGVGVFEWTINCSSLTVEEPEEEVIVTIPEGSVNIASYATPAGSHDYTTDGGGVAELNDGDDALLNGSAVTDNGFWHTWGTEGADSWVQYTWDEEVVLTGMDIYYFATGDQFKTKKLQVSYLSADEEWIEMSDAKGLGTKLDQWNATLFESPITTTSIKMVLTPVSHAVGILEWKVYGYEAETYDDESEENETTEGTITTTEEVTTTTEETTTTTEEITTTTEETTTTTEEQITSTDDNKTAEEKVKTPENESSETKTETTEVTMPEYQTENVQLFEVEELVAEAIEVIQTGIARSRLRANVVDDGYPNMSLTYQWTVTSAPEDATVEIEQSDRPITNVTFDKEGTYELTLIVTDGELIGEDTVVYEVKLDEELPQLLAQYTFNPEEVDAEEREVLDVSGSKYDARYSYNPNPVFETVDERDVISMNGGFCGYVKLTNELTLGKVTEEKGEEVTEAPNGGNVDVDNSGSDNNNSGKYEDKDDDSNQNNGSSTASPVVIQKQNEVPKVEEETVLGNTITGIVESVSNLFNSDDTQETAIEDNEMTEKNEDIQDAVSGESVAIREVIYEEAAAAPVISNTSVTYGDGKIGIVLETEEGNSESVSGVTFTSLENVINACLTPEEKELVQKGENIHVRMNVTKLQENVPPIDKALVEKALPALQENVAGLQIAGYLDITIEKCIGPNEEWNKIGELNEEIEIKLNIPSDMYFDNADYYVLRVHDGETTLLEDLDSDNTSITIRTKLFSTYSLMYTLGEDTLSTVEDNVESMNAIPVIFGIVLMALAVVFVVYMKNKERENV